MIRAPLAFNKGASIPTRWQFARGTLCCESGCDSEHMIAVRTSARDLDYPVDPACQIVRFRLHLPARLRQMLVPDPVFPQQLR